MQGNCQRDQALSFKLSPLGSVRVRDTWLPFGARAPQRSRPTGYGEWPGSVWLVCALRDARRLGLPAPVEVLTACWALLFRHTEADQHHQC